MNSIVIGDIEIELIKKNIKNMHLSVHPPDGRVRISAPEHIDDETIRLFVLSKLSWIKKHRKKFDTQIKVSPREFLPGENHCFMGAGYLLNLIQSNEKQRVELRDNKQMDLYVRPGHTKDKRETILNEWYRKELKVFIPEYIEKWESIVGVNVDDWGIKRMKTRWGSCNVRDKRIWLNLELAKKDPSLLEYVIVHEMVHLLERYHNDIFKTYMDKFIPDWKSLRDELNR